MVLALSPRDLEYEIAMGMNEKMDTGRGANLVWTVDGLAKGIASGYGDTKENRLIVMEGIEAMFSLGLLTASGSHGDPAVYLTRAGRAIRFSDDAMVHRIGHLEASALLDEDIVGAVWTPYLRGDYDIAVAYTFKRVEVAMRTKGGYDTTYFGDRLIKKFFGDFRLPNAPDGLKPATLTPEEQFFQGTFALYRNPASHQDDTITDYARAMEVMLVGNHLLHLVRGTVRRSASP
jgi:hypothetical protein